MRHSARSFPLLLAAHLGCASPLAPSSEGSDSTPDTSTGPGGDPDSSSPGDDTGSAAPPPPGLIRFSEVMYNPVKEDDYEDIHEFLELHNADDQTIDLDGWALSDGVEFLFEGAELTAGGTLVVTGNREALLRLYPDLEASVVVGDWEGMLDNGGERIELTDADGTVVDALTYDDAAPWPLGADGLGVQDDFLPAGQLPLEDHAGRGRSLQRVSFQSSADDPGNWVASAFGGMDPGRVDTVTADTALAHVAAIAWGESETGPLPPGQDIRITVEVGGGSIEDATLEWFADDVSSSDEVIGQIALRDDGTEGDTTAGDGTLTALIPAQADSTVLRVRVVGDLGRGVEVASPRDGDPNIWHSRFVGLPIPGDTTPYRLFIDPGSWTSLWDMATDGRVLDCGENPGWGTRVPAIFVSDGGVHDVLVRYQGSRWNRLNGRTMGAWTAPGPARPDPNRALSWSIKFPRYATLDGREQISLNKLTQSCPGLSSVVGFQLFEAAGLPVPETRYRRLFVNGQYYNYTLEIESPGEDMLERWLAARADADPDLPAEPGAPHLFKSGGCNCDEGPYGWGDERPLVASCGWTALERYAATYKRKTWSWAGHSELQALIEGLDAARASDDSTLRTFLDTHFDVQAVLAYMAVMNWAVPFDDMFQNHYLMQRRSDGRWLMAPWDLDRNFGGWEGASASIYLGEVGDPDNRSGWSNRIKDAFFRVYRTEFESTLFAFNEDILHPGAVISLVDAAESQWRVTEATATPAGAQCNFPDGAQAFRAFAQARHDVIAARAAGR